MIVHLDADAFYASVEQAADVRLRGKAIAVGGEKRGVVASASYEARKFGVKSAMPTARARRLCPKLIVVPGDFEKYERFSRLMFSYAGDFTPLVEVSSIDEGYYDVTGHRSKSAQEIAETVRRAIHQSLKITVSEGVGANKLVSQIASKLRKPANLIEVAKGGECDFLWPLANHWLPGIGPKTSEVLNSAGLREIHQIAHTPADLLSMFVGGGAAQLRLFANGIDDRPVIVDHEEAKSYSEQQTFGADVTDEEFIVATVRGMADRLMAKVRDDRKSIRTVTLRLRYNDMDEVQRNVSLDEPTDIEHDIYGVLCGLLRRAWERRVSVRLAGLKFSKIYDAIAAPLPIDREGKLRANHQKLAGVLDKLRHDLGPGTVMRGHDLWLKQLKNTPREDLERSTRPRPAPARAVRRKATFVPLNVRSHYSFCDSLLSIPRIIELAQQRGITALALTDPNLHGAVEFFSLAKEASIKPIIAAEVKCEERTSLMYVESTQGYGNLCRILSAEKLTHAFFREHLDGLTNVISVAGVALPEIRYAAAADRQKYDIVQSIRTLTRLHEAHADKRRGDFHFLSQAEANNRFSIEALRTAEEIAERCTFEFEIGRLRFPHFTPADGSTPHAFLAKLAHEGLCRRYGPGQHRAQLDEELSIIASVGYEEYFLTTWQILEDCRAKGIDWITRGSAADSLVCYALGISSVCPIRFDLYFKRFLNKDRMALNKLPDIDIDFPHDRKDDVVDLIFARFGSTHAAIVGGFSTFRARSAIADIAKVLGVSEYRIRRFTEHIPNASAAHAKDAVEASQGCRDVDVTENPYRAAIELAEMLDGFPRHAKMHPCGVVIARDPIADLSPVFRSAKGYPTTHFEMESVEAIGLIKMDILAQGGLAVIRDTLAMLGERGVEVDIDDLEPWEDKEIWKMIAGGDSRGVHHIESPAMCSLARMSQARNIDQLIAIVSVIRPGAANGEKKMQFARRCQGLEAPGYPHPSLEPVLRSTYGLIAYEEHVLQICDAFAGLDGGRADVLRRALGKENAEKIATMKPEFVAAAEKLARTPADIETVWEMLLGFSGYSFCKAHSTAYGVEAYAGAHLKRYFPAEFLAAILSNGKGFYSALAYTLECRRLGIGFGSPDTNASRRGYFAEHDTQGARIRVPLAAIKDLTTSMRERWEREKDRRPYESMQDFFVRVNPSVSEMQNLIRVGVFDSFGESRTAQIWSLHRLARWRPEGAQGVLFENQIDSELPSVPLSEPTALERLRTEHELLGYTVSGHPLDLYPEVAWATYCPISNLGNYPNEEVIVCGLIIADRLYHQVTGETMKFISICDYSGIVECELFAQTYRAFGIQTVRYPVIEITARVSQYDGGVGYSLDVKRVAQPRTERRPAGKEWAADAKSVPGHSSTR